jgi:hypothetical protein
VLGDGFGLWLGENILIFSMVKRAHLLSNTPFIMTLIFPKLRSINLMALTQRVGSLKWIIIYLCMELSMSWTNFVMLFSICIMNVDNGGNGVKMNARGMLCQPNLLQSSMTSLTMTHVV